MSIYKSNDGCDLFGELYGWRRGGEVAEFKAMTPNPNMGFGLISKVKFLGPYFFHQSLIYFSSYNLGTNCNRKCSVLKDKNSSMNVQLLMEAWKHLLNLPSNLCLHFSRKQSVYLDWSSINCLTLQHFDIKKTLSKLIPK
uniref:Uncharacterized protein n=1 Tax=Cucumis melo TaxID=3656 RepID=A0A9I9EGT5_CUCME